MNGWIFGVMDMAIVGIPVTAFCIWQLISINREIAKDKRPEDDE